MERACKCVRVCVCVFDKKNTSCILVAYFQYKLGSCEVNPQHLNEPGVAPRMSAGFRSGGQLWEKERLGVATHGKR